MSTCVAYIRPRNVSGVRIQRSRVADIRPGYRHQQLLKPTASARSARMNSSPFVADRHQRNNAGTKADHPSDIISFACEVGKGSYVSDCCKKCSDLVNTTQTDLTRSPSTSSYLWRKSTTSIMKGCPSVGHVTSLIPSTTSR